MDFQEVIAKRRFGKGNSDEELRSIAQGAADGEVPDYQLTAWLMAECFRPLSPEETAEFTTAMAQSGDRLDLSGLPKPWVDKHSTGGVGDKTSIVLLPLLACCGMTIVKMSGRGLGITGGTVDKLESITGFRMDLSPKELIDQAKRIGLAISGQTSSLAPADKTLYALRDVTATVDSIPLIVSSILCKKLAGGADQIVLDVKCGSGGFMPDLQRASELAEALMDTGKRIGLPIHVAITDMNQPLGRMVGNLLEVKEAVQVLQGAHGRVSDLCIRLAAHALVATSLAPDEESATRTVRDAILEGRASAKAKEWFSAQMAQVDVFEDFEALPVAPVRQQITAPGSGYVAKVDARAVGEAVVALGGGRKKKSDVIDPTVGVEFLKEVGDEISSGETMFVVHARSEEDAKAAASHILRSVEISEGFVERPELILKMLNSEV
jgi:pyrimidine-nucleoside phosphorylase